MKLPLPQHPGVAAIVVVLGALLLWGFWPQPVFVEAVRAVRAPMTVTIEEEGRTRVIDRFVIYAPVDGVACRIDLDVGDRVDQGQTLLTIAPLESRVLDPRSRAEAAARVAAAGAALEAAEHQVDATEASAAFSRSEIQRLKPLLAKGMISQGEFDRAEKDRITAEAALESARHRVEVAKYEQEAAETALKYTAGSQSGDAVERVPVRSPITGRILKKSRGECEGPVRTGEELLVVGDPSLLEVEVDLLSPDAVTIQPGMKVLFEHWGGENALEGRVRRIEPVGFTKISALGVEEQRVYVISDFTSPATQWSRLGDGYRIDARFVLWHEENVLQVPASSLFRVDEGWALFRVGNGRARQRIVKIGQRNGLVAQILDGLTEGESIINHPSDEVEDGVRVRER
ncbi:MAG: efflux RND transporter periplasmic adaptor subunit [Gammaproteobacteria bacterium]